MAAAAAHAGGEANGKVMAVIACLVTAGFTLLFALQIPLIASGETLRIAYPWVPSIGVTLSVYIDGLSLTFALLISGIGLFIMLYATAYMKGHPERGKFLLYLLLFMLSMLGLVLADNLITLFVFWELTTVTSYLLIGFDAASAKARRSALQALLLTGAGGLALLAGLIMMGLAAGTFELSEILSQGKVLQEHALYLPILILVLAGAFTKSAQVPFHFWLPNAMAAPTPVSAYLHSATMVKAGIYLLARMHPTLGGSEVWIWTLTIFGAVTAVVSSILALRQTDLKLALAYTTVMALGTLTMFLGAESTIAVAAAVTFLIVHCFYKAALFMVVGIIDHGTGTREADRLRGLAKVMPITAVAAGAAALSMAGFPPFLGFIGKELKYEGALAIASEPIFVASAAILANSLMVAVAGIVALRPFYGPKSEAAESGHEAPAFMWIGPLLLAAGGLAFGLAPWLIGNSLVQPGVTAVLGRPETVKLALWHGINLPLMMSILTFALGIVFYLIHRPLRSKLIELDERYPKKGDWAWDRLLDGLKAFAAIQTRVLQGGLLRRYIMTVFASMAIILVATFWATDAWRLPADWPQLLVKEWAVIILITAGIGLTVYTQSRLTAICGLGVVGVGIALVFLMYGAPDVAITQLLVETLVVVLVVLVMLRLPSLEREPGGWARRWRILLSVGVGGSVTAIMLAMLQAPLNRSITTYFEETAVPDAFGRNIVNVILVDFRALDTFGEVAVVALAALGAYALIRGASARRRSQ
ncbi:MAG: putative monovalent cation/H+ antiporter subunit A [Pseudomonadota bacterium]